MSTQTPLPALISKVLVNTAGVPYANANVVINDQVSNQPMRIYTDATGLTRTSINGNTMTDANGRVTAYVTPGRVCKISVSFVPGQIIDTFYDVSPGDPTDINALSAIDVARARANAGADSVTVPTTGQSVQIPDNCNLYVVNPAGTLSSLTINLPLNPVNRQRVMISALQIVTTATITATGTNQTIKNPPTTFASANTYAEWEWNLTTASWLRIG